MVYIFILLAAEKWPKSGILRTGPCQFASEKGSSAKWRQRM